MTLHVLHCRHTKGEPQSIDVADWTWAHPSELDQFAFPGADRKILAALTAGLEAYLESNTVAKEQS
jgi:A/G-specific adenine glycosylase